eukprot:6180473-Pleurochrysis_carterae.AAC.4
MLHGRHLCFRASVATECAQFEHRCWIALAKAECGPLGTIALQVFAVPLQGVIDRPVVAEPTRFSAVGLHQLAACIAIPSKSPFCTLRVTVLTRSRGWLRSCSDA